MGKRAQGASHAATLIIFVGMMIVIYILMLSPEDRADLLNDTNSSNGGSTGPGGEDNITILLDESPGSLFPTEQTSFDHPLSQLILSAASEDNLLLSQPSLYIMTSKMNKKTEPLQFKFDQNKQKINGLLLSFNVESASGRLLIDLNGNEIFNGELESGSQQPIQINPTFVKDSNTLTFSVSEVPWYRFWSRNQYELRELKLISSTQDLEGMQSTTTFRLSDQEVDEFKSGYVRFTVECGGDKQSGRLRVRLNDNLISSSVPDCLAVEKIDITKEDLTAGKNDLSFELSEGTLYLTNLAAHIEINAPRWPIYYFDINSTVWNRISRSHLDVPMRVDFVEDSKEKDIEVTINSRKFYIETKENSYTKKIQSYLKEDNNYVRIVPQSELNIANLKIYAVED